MKNAKWKERAHRAARGRKEMRARRRTRNARIEPPPPRVTVYYDAPDVRFDPVDRLPPPSFMSQLRRIFSRRIGS